MPFCKKTKANTQTKANNKKQKKLTKWEKERIQRQEQEKREREEEEAEKKAKKDRITLCPFRRSFISLTKGTLMEYLLVSAKENNLPLRLSMYENPSSYYLQVEGGKTGASSFHFGDAYSLYSHDTRKDIMNFRDPHAPFHLNHEIQDYGIKLVIEEQEIPAFFGPDGKPSNEMVVETTLFWALLDA